MNTYIKITISLFIFLVIFLFLSIFYFYNKQENKNLDNGEISLNTKKIIQKKDEVREAVWADDYALAYEKLEEKIKSKDTSVAEKNYLNYLKLSFDLSRNANIEDEDFIKVTNQLKNFSLDTNNLDRNRAYAVNDLLRLYTNAFNVKVFNQIFSGDYSKFFYTNSKEKSIDNLASFSYNLYPTSDALMLQNYVHNVALLDKNNLDEVSKQESIDFLLKNLNKVDKQLLVEFNEDLRKFDSRYFSILHKKAFVEAIIALKSKNSIVRDEYLNKFKQDYEGVIYSYENKTAKPYSRTASLVSYSYFYYAAFLNEIYGKKESEKINIIVQNLSKIVRLKNEQSASFRNFVEQQMLRDPGERDHNYYLIKNLSENNKDFKKIIEEIISANK